MIKKVEKRIAKPKTSKREKSDEKPRIADYMLLDGISDSDSSEDPNKSQKSILKQSSAKEVVG